MSDPQEIVVAFKQAEQAELVLVEELRERNLEGNSRSDVMAAQYCELCRWKDFGKSIESITTRTSVIWV